MTIPRSFAGDSGFARVGPLLPLLSILAEAGVSADAVLNQAGVSLDVFQNPENRISFEAAGRLLETSVCLTQLPDLGLRLGNAGKLANFGLVGELVCTAATVGDGLRVFVECFAFQDSGGVLMLLPKPPKQMAIAYSIHMANTPGRNQIQDMAVALGCNILKELCGSAWMPSHVQFPHANAADVSPLLSASIFSNTRFDAEVAAIVFPANWMKRLLPASDPVRHARLGHELAFRSLVNIKSLSDRVRRLLPPSIFSGNLSSKRVAWQLGMKERTLRKHLAEEGTGFLELANLARFEIAQQLLRDTSMAIKDIAMAMNYSDPNAFSRAFHGWATESPTEWRRRVTQFQLETL
ncbi:MAG: AraC family transcriptional regulator ligand-binding domain-containing protein [Dechloromonas sp.]|nr:AraC family transcriptional regulator ligand-binding domain-containing protein [Dechloromonas sp.]